MERKQDYTPEFRAEAVKVVLAARAVSGRGGEAAVGAKGDVGELGGQRQGINETGCTRSAHGGKLEEAKLKQLRKNLAEAILERDILKTAMAHFARESLQGTRS